jgi:hypothetical protein
MKSIAFFLLLALASPAVHAGPCPASGSCFVQHPTPGCNDAVCCDAVCDDDPFCCNNQWDNFCVTGANQRCCGGNLTPSCFVVHNTPACSNAGCCETVCAADPFCCSVQWDQLCVNQATATCTCGGSSAGSCFFGHNNPACNNAACCEVVCSLDNFCCDVLWDGACAFNANMNCCGGSSAGSCFEPNNTPACSIATCCTAVCAQDPFCCDVGWDGICANQAITLCSCGGPQAGSCFSIHPTPGCDDEQCCQVVCGEDPFCCSVQWDGLCVNGASTLCSNNSCAFHVALAVGTTTFSNVGATTDGPMTCGLLGSDVWYSFTAPAAGTLTINTLGSAFDTAMAAYDGCTCISDLACPVGSTCGSFHSCEGGCICWSTTNQGPVCMPDFFCSAFLPCAGFGGICPVGMVCVTASCCGTDLCVPITECNGGAGLVIGAPGGSGLTGTGQFVEDGAGGVAGGPTGGLLDCNDDFGGTFQSQISFPVVAGQCCLIQVGGFNSAQGSGQINVSLDTGVEGDVNGDGGVNVSDLVVVVLDWGCVGACPGDADFNGVTNVSDLVTVILNWTP